MGNLPCAEGIKLTPRSRFLVLIGDITGVSRSRWCPSATGDFTFVIDIVDSHSLDSPIPILRFDQVKPLW